MAQEDVRLSGSFVDSAGNGISGKTASLFAEGTITPVLATDTTDSAGEWDFTRTTPGRYDVQLVNGTQTYRVLSRDKFQVTELQSRNATSLTQPAGIFTNTYTNGGAASAGLTAIYSFRPSTESTGVESAVAGVNGSSVYNDFHLTNSAATPEDFIAGRLAWEAVDVTDGSEDSKLNLWTMKAGTLTEVLHLDGTSLHPETTDVVSLGTSALNFSDLFLDSGAVVNFDSGNLTLTHSAGLLTVSGGLTVTGTTTLNGALVLGDAAADTLTVNATIQGGTPLVFEGASAGDFETSFAITNPSADRTITFPDATLTVNAAADISGTTLASNVVTSSLTTVGALNAGSITSGFTSIDVGAGAITTTGALSIASMGTNWTNAGRTVADMGIATTIDINGGTIDGAIIGGAATAAVTGTVITATTNFAGNLTGNVTGNTSGTAATVTTPAQGNITSLGTLSTLTVDNVIVDGTTIGHTSDTDLLTLTSGNLAVAGDVSVSGTFTVNGTTTTVNTTNTVVTDNLLELNSGATSNANDSGIIIERGSTGDNAILMWDESATGFTVGTTTATASSTGNLANFAAAPFTAAAITGTVITASSNFAGALTGEVTGNAATATKLATTRAIAVAGDVTGTANFDGSAAISITTTLANDAIVTANITNANVTVAKMAANSVDSDQYVDGSIDNEHIANGTIALAKTALVAGTNITLATNTLNVDDAFLTNTGDDTTDGTITAAGFTLADAANVSIGVPLLANADHTTTGITAQMLAGGAIAAFDLVCIHSTTQEVVEADASAAATSRVIGIAPVAISDTATGTVLLNGFVRDDTWAWTTGGVLFLSETAGAMTHTAPTTSGAFVQAVGVALSPDVVYINPSIDVIEHA